jgi:hypothetical protein
VPLYIGSRSLMQQELSEEIIKASLSILDKTPASV